LLAIVHYAYDFFPRRHETALAFNGALGGLLLWRMRLSGGRLLWLACWFGVIEGAQLFACQLAANWTAVPQVARFSGVCDAYTGLPLYGWGVVALALLAAYIHDKKDQHGLD
jgi:hypothetical protein